MHCVGIVRAVELAVKVFSKAAGIDSEWAGRSCIVVGEDGMLRLKSEWLNVLRNDVTFYIICKPSRSHVNHHFGFAFRDA